ncbi:helix-turn-helix transcriptional regulator [Cellulomonas oligotrophica]|uniref:Plasmid maintenance system antidote protein VapI n=1 Tax=Cellulomonas oligotrophica TaxID=931536 RepID=A0A7Y9FI84_9CELL|nr:helix-turn-helix transcriptional regulator [Cellulomonas oligotrophica]NYD87803.1 plasmid maintenance system antidote protein VapI [Cellulomonas oligotrophica]GIG32992.1 hypothetical protein Col01nite_21510 [Cellulomonas oligotrophica]
MPNRNGSTLLDRTVAGEVRAEIARHRDVSVSHIAEALDIRRATLSARLNGHVPFSPSLLSDVAQLLGTSASALTARAEALIANSDRASA